MNRRTYLSTLLALGAAVSSQALYAQPSAFPTRPITVVVPFPAGGVADSVTRIIGEEVAKILGQPVVIDPRPGGNSNIGTMLVAKANADGYTWLMSAPSLTANPSLYSGIWDPLKDFTGVGMVVSAPNLITVPSSLPVSNLQEFVSWAKKSPGTLNYGNPGIGSSLHLNTELLKLAAGVDLVSVNYKGQPPAVIDLLRGDLSVMLLSVGLAVPHIKAGKLKPLAVVATHRMPELPNVPTLAEAGYPEANVVPWYGYVVPSRTPAPVAKKINDAISKALTSKAVQDSLRALGTDPEKPRTIAEINAVIKADFIKYGDVIRKASIKLD